MLITLLLAMWLRCSSCSNARTMAPQVGHKLRVGGWVKTGREAGGGDFCFLEVNDGSTFSNLQVSNWSSAVACARRPRPQVDVSDCCRERASITATVGHSGTVSCRFTGCCARA